ncbi:DUF971 domain-containing protein [Hyphomonas sp. FCG-A18]|uniref:gamma-butyrobetaine hydroxylase-like domain-containing protein n=1 Tax=Hyphomonas sp. FCG-A18 TaxID=3080019 RepID=UPI002B3230A6|nr:DUF971 domain-containing protein [Hyphomonas sp. FCG-A18]
MSHSWPTRLAFSKSKARLAVAYDDGAEFEIDYPTLRLNSPSAEVQGHGAGPKPPAPIIPDDLTVLKADPVGRYAVRIYFSDGHSSGLYTWAWLRELGEQGVAAA